MTMSEPFEQDVPVSAYGAARAAAYRAHLEASQAASTEAAIEAHRASSAVLRAAHQGLYGHATPQDMGQVVSEQQPTVGGAWGQERAIERLGGTFTHANDGPAPPPVDLTRVNDRPGYQRGESPLSRYMRGRD